MLLQTNSYVVPKEKRAEHARLLRRFRQALARLGCTDFEVYEQVGTNWSADQSGGRFVQLMRFRDRKHQLAVQAAEREDPVAQALVAEFCELINFPYQQENNLFAVGYYTALLGPTHSRASLPEEPASAEPAAHVPPPAAPFSGEALQPFAEPNPDLSRLAQEFIRSARAVQQIQATAGPNQDSAEVEHAVEAQKTDEAAPAEPSAPANGDGKYEFHIPQYAAAWGEEDEQQTGPVESTPIDDAVPSLDELLDLEIGQTVAEETVRTPEPESPDESESSGIGHVLQASLTDEELDIALPAELVDSTELDAYGPHSDDSHSLHGDAIDQQPRRG